MLTYDTDKYDLVHIRLANFPHTTFSNHVDGKNGPIDFYNVDPDIKVLALDKHTNKLTFSKVKYWSEHKDRLLEIVTLSNGLQIYTDDDPRAIFGITSKNYLDNNIVFERFTPTKAMEQNVLVPIANYDLKAPVINRTEIDLAALNEDIHSFQDALDFVYNLYNLGITACFTFIDNKYKLYYPSKTKELKLNDEILLTSITDIEKTNQKETGYDLTIDEESQTFTSTTGVILSNTINIHVPSLPEAQKDIKERLLPSKQIYAIRNVPKKGKDGEPVEQEEVINKLKQDLIIGLYSANKAKAKKQWLFATEKEALDAIKAGKVKLSDDIEILDK